MLVVAVPHRVVQISKEGTPAMQSQKKTPQKLTLVYALEEPPKEYAKSIFLAGPTPRSLDVASWRPRAIELLRAAGYDGVVFIPELRDGREHDWEAQVEWEERCLNLADCILFWLPRQFATMPGFNTNDEWGVWKDSGKAVFGAPPQADRTAYQRYYAKKLLVPYAETLEETVRLAITELGDGALRKGGEREVPLPIWRTASFQQWYEAQKDAGNVLVHARQVFAYRARRKQVMYLWTLHVDVYVRAEKRHKANELVMSRTDVVAVLLYQRGATPRDTTIVMVQEFRSPVSNSDGLVCELPGGSSFDESLSAREIAADEVREEAGLSITLERLVYHGEAQLVATFSAHRMRLFSAELTPEELAWVMEQAASGATFGSDANERTRIKITTVGAIMAGAASVTERVRSIDWSTIGAIWTVLDEIYAQH